MVVSDQATDDLPQLVEAITSGGGGIAVAHKADVTVEAEVEALVAFARATFGGLDIMVNNAAIGNLIGSVETFDVGDWDRLMASTCAESFSVSSMPRAMIAGQKRGRIISIGSQASKSGISIMSAYTASRHGIVGLTRSAAIDLGKRSITVNAVCPNHISSDLGDWPRETLSAARGSSIEEYWTRFRRRVPIGRTERPLESANACLFLASDLAGYLTGEAMNVSGGEEYH